MALFWKEVYQKVALGLRSRTAVPALCEVISHRPTARNIIAGLHTFINTGFLFAPCLGVNLIEGMTYFNRSCPR